MNLEYFRSSQACMQDVYRTGVGGSGSGGMNFLDREVGLADAGNRPHVTRQIFSLCSQNRDKMVPVSLLNWLAVLLSVFMKVESSQQCEETRHNFKGNLRTG